MKIPLTSLKPWSPFKNVVWASLDRGITREEIREAIEQKKFLTEPINTDTLDTLFKTPREDHVKRIAFLVVNGWKDEIHLDVGVPSMCCHVDWIIMDGNHRLAAAFYREDETIEAGIMGEARHAAELLHLDQEEIERQWEHSASPTRHTRRMG